MTTTPDTSTPIDLTGPSDALYVRGGKFSGPMLVMPADRTDADVIGLAVARSAGLRRMLDLLSRHLEDDALAIVEAIEPHVAVVDTLLIELHRRAGARSVAARG